MKLAPATPLALGELLTVEEIRARYFAHIKPAPSLRWVAAQLPVERRTRAGRCFAWWTADVEAALAGMRGAA